MNRRHLNRLINLFSPFTSEVIGSPKNAVSVIDFLDTHQNDGTIDYSENLDISSIVIDFPSFFDKHQLILKHNIFLAKLINSRVWGKNGSILSQNDFFLYDVSRQFDSNSKFDHPIFYTLKQISAKKYDGKIAVIGTSGANIYYHWMIDIIPRLGLILKKYSISEIDYFVTEFGNLPFQLETLEQIGISIDRILPSNNTWNFHIKCKELILPSLVSPLDQVTKFQIDYLRLIYKDFIEYKVQTQRIYISRKKVGRREIINENELLEFLSKYGFKTVYCEDLKVIEQVKLFSISSFIVCSHGSALLNIAFCHPQTVIVDIFNESHINPCYWLMSKINQLNYYYYKAKAIPIDHNFRNDNSLLDMNDFKKYFCNLIGF